MTFDLTILIPAHNEAEVLPKCLASLSLSHWDRDGRVQVLVLPNGCSDATAEVARNFAPQFNAINWQLDVIEIAKGGKLNALNVGDNAALGGFRIYLDADVTVSADLVKQIAEALDTPTPRYASGTLNISAPATFATRAFRTFYRHVPFITTGVPGCGIFAVNAAGRDRWADWPDIIADDTFARLSFAPSERIAVNATYDWPLVEGFRNLIKVRRRQNAGVAEIEQKFPHLLANDDKPIFTKSSAFSVALRHPIGAFVYGSVGLICKHSKSANQSWSRGR